MLNTKRYLVFFSVLITVVGLWLLLRSPILGLNATDSYVRQVGGTIATTQYVTLEQSFQTTYRILGAIVFTLGGFFLIRALTSYGNTQK